MTSTEIRIAVLCGILIVNAFVVYWHEKQRPKEVQDARSSRTPDYYGF